MSSRVPLAAAAATAVAVLGAACLLGRSAEAALPIGADDPAQLRCLALLALAEAAGEGPLGMSAVVHVVRNRVADGRFAADACTAALAPGQFQPVAEQRWLRTALQAAAREEPGSPALPEGAGPWSAQAVDRALELASATLTAASDPTGGALFFANPDLMDPAPCRWFADLAPITRIGRHMFFTDSAVESAGPAPAALDCGAIAGGRGLSTDRADVAAPGPESARPPVMPVSIARAAAALPAAIGAAAAAKPRPPSRPLPRLIRLTAAPTSGLPRILLRIRRAPL